MLLKNVLGREIPDHISGYKEVKPYTGAYENIQGEYVRTTSKFKVKPIKKSEKHAESKLVASIEEAIDKVGLKDGMTVSFHHHMRNGDYVTNMVMKVIEAKGYKNIHVAASGLFKCHEPLVEMIKSGVITNITLSTISPGPLAKAITQGLLKHPAVFMSHGGRPRAIESGELHIDVAFIAAPTCDPYGNMNGSQGKSACGLLSYAYADAHYADNVIAITDHLVSFPACPVEISQECVDYVVQVEEIGNPEGIAFGPTKATTDPINLSIARTTAKLIDEAGFIKEGMSMQTGAGATSIAVADEVGKIMRAKNVVGSFGSGGITGYFVKMLEEGLFRGLFDVQCFDQVAIESISKNKNHMPMSATHYANPNNRGCLVNQLDVMILGATEVDIDFNVNVVTGSDGIIMSSSGGNNDCAAGAKISIIVTNLLKGRLCMLRDKVTTITTPGETVDVIVTDRGIAINPRRKDLTELLKESSLPIMDIHKLKAIGDKLVGIPQPLELTDQVVAIVEYRDGTVIDVVRKPK